MDTTLQQAQRLIDQNRAQGLGTQFAGSSYDVNKNTDTTVTPPMINSTNPVVIPPTPVDTTNYAAVTTSTASPYLQQAEARLTEASKGANIATADDTALRGSIKDLMGFNQNKATDLAQLEQDANINIQQKEIQGLTNEINQIAKETTAAKLALENQPYITVGVQGQQAKVDRDNAVKTLILNSALQAKQGNLSLALNQIQRSLDLKYKPKEDELAYKIKLIDLNRDSFTGAQKKQADAQSALLTAQEKALTVKKSNEDAIGKIYTEAASNGAPNAVLSQIEASMAKGDTMTAIKLGASYARNSVEQAYKVAQTNKINAETAEINAKALELRQKIVAGGSAAELARKQSETLETLSLVDSILSDPELKNVVGLKSPGAAFGGFFGEMVGSPTVKVANEIRQLQALLSLENRQKLKGSGAISDFESKTLQRSASAFSTGLSNEAATSELKRIRGVMATASGLPALVQITDPKTGKFVTVNANRETINQAIIDGARVEYK